MAAAAPQRVVAVRAKQQGSGYLLAPRLVLTAAHLLDGFTAGEAAVPGGAGWSDFEVVGRDDELDVALLRTSEELAPAEVAAPVLWGRVDSLEPVPGCHLTGFPVAGRGEADRLDSSQVLGTLTPGAGLLSDRQVVVLTQLPPWAELDSGSPWSGLSGAALRYQEYLLGVVVTDRRRSAWHGSQLGLVPAADILASPRLAGALTAHLGGVPELHGISAAETADTRFAHEYAEAIRADYGRIRIFGLRQRGQGRRGWELDAAYLSLEAGQTEDRSRPDYPEPAAPQRVDQQLAGRRRVLLRGQAGSGKTTLVQWLAVQALAGRLGPELAGLNHRVPLVLQLRKLFRQDTMKPRPEEFLRLDDRMCADREPPGWTHRMLSSGRAMLLVDGLDEVPAAERDEALEWLECLLDHYPDVWTLATVRPSAVPPGWLDHLGFDDLSLSPMTGGDRRLFVERWHQAALRDALKGVDAVAEQEELKRETARHQADLLKALERSPQLDQLADSPLLCAMLCALNRESDGVLPTRRMEIYRDALTMMLVRRDETRSVRCAEQLRLSEEEQLALLRRIAHWLVRNNQVEGRRSDALAQITKALRDLPDAAAQGDAEAVYRHLLNRSGLIAETSVETFQFVHRTFQDYLAAMEFKEERDFGLLADHAAEEQWADVIRLTVGHCGRNDRGELLTRILDEGDRARDIRKPDIFLLAGSCLPFAPEVAREVREAVLLRIEQHLDVLLTGTDHLRLAEVGEALIPVLRRAAEGNSYWGRYLLPGIVGRIGGPQALDLLESWADRPHATNVAGQWSHFGEREFARRVLTRVDRSRTEVQVASPAQLAELVRLGAWPGVVLQGSQLADSSLWRPLAEHTVHLVLDGVAGFSDLSSFRGWPSLKELVLRSCRQVTDLSPLADTALESLWLGTVPRLTGDAIDAMGRMPALTRVRVSATDLARWGSTVALPGVRELTLGNLSDGYPLGRIPELFPNLGLLRVTFPLAESLDLTELAAHPSLPESVVVDCRYRRTRILGQELFPPGILTVN